MKGELSLQPISDAIELAVKEGQLEKLYEELKKLRLKGEVSASQARKFLEEARKIKETPGKALSNIIKSLILLEYQKKRKLLKEEIANFYSRAFQVAQKNLGKENVLQNLYDVIEMLTVAFYEKKGD